MVLIIFVVGSEDSKGLLVCASVVGAFGSLDGVRCLHGCEVVNLWYMIMGVGNLREQLGLLGYFPLVFDSALSSVAVTLAAKANTETRAKLRILIL